MTLKLVVSLIGAVLAVKPVFPILVVTLALVCKRPSTGELLQALELLCGRKLEKAPSLPPDLLRLPEMRAKHMPNPASH